MQVQELSGQTSRLSGLNNINIILGRNGAGKSRFLRDIEARISQEKQEFYVRYVSPERAGSFKRDGNVLTNMSNNSEWLRTTRAVNQANNFKAASAMLFREAETLYLRRLSSTQEIRMDPSRNFEADRLSKVNQLLTNITMVMGNADFEFRSIAGGELVEPHEISSGESEAVALAAEILYFFDTIDPTRFNVLLLDEPDVHLHPDLQGRLGRLLLAMLEEFSSYADRIAICIATHSTPMVCSLAASESVSIGTKNFSVDVVTVQPVSAELCKVAPFFGHPLSLSLSDDAVLILEGEDDQRVWQQAARTSKGKIKVFPVLTGSVDQHRQTEAMCVELLNAIYEHPVAFSIRDGDGIVGQKLDHQGPLKRYRLDCYAIENALVTDPCLQVMNSNWDGFVAAAEKWAEANKSHNDIAELMALVHSADRLQHVKIKNIRQLICAVAGCKKPWEVVVGQAIGALKTVDVGSQNMLVDFLGADLVGDVVFRSFQWQ